MKHTTEPWICSGRSIKQDYSAIGLGPASGQTIGSVMGGSTSGPYFVESDAECEANARRIVACVNACAGVTTEELEQGGFVTGLIERLEEKERQRDALQEELESIATAEWREFDPDTRRCAYEFVLWAQSRARHTLNRVLSGE